MLGCFNQCFIGALLNVDSSLILHLFLSRYFITLMPFSTIGLEINRDKLTCDIMSKTVLHWKLQLVSTELWPIIRHYYVRSGMAIRNVYDRQ